MIVKNVTENAKVDFIAVAPEGKEVEELTSKEILQSLRKKISVEEYMGKGRRREYRDNRNRDSRSSRDKEEPEKKERKIKKLTAKEKDKIEKEISDLVGTKGAIAFNSDLEVIK